MFFTRFETPPGTSLEATTEHPRHDEKWLLAQPELVGLFAAVGMGGPDGVARANQGMMFATLTPRKERKRKRARSSSTTRARCSARCRARPSRSWTRRR